MTRKATAPAWTPDDIVIETKALSEDGLVFDVTAIEPFEAESLLQKAPKPPRVGSRLLAELRGRHVRGETVIDGEAVCIMEDGTISQGAEKLNVAAETGLPFPTCLIRGLKQGDIAVSGDFALRSRRDFLDAQGVPNALVVSNAYNILHLICARGIHGGTAASRMSHRHLDHYRNVIGDLREEVEVVRTIPVSVGPRALLLACLAIAQYDDRELARTFFAEIATAGRGGEAPKLAQLLVDMIRNWRKETTETRRPREIYMGWIFEAWNTRRAGTTPKEFLFKGRRAGRGWADYPTITGIKKVPIPQEPKTPEKLDKSAKSKLARMYRDMAGKTQIRIRLARDIDSYAQADLLDRNTSNRKIREHYVNRYQRMMAEGRWELNGKTIKIDNKGVLRDGQHRILAAIRARVAFSSFIVEGLDPSIFVDLDQHGRVMLKEVLQREGFSNAQGLAAGLGALDFFPQIREGLTDGNEGGVRSLRQMSFDEQRRFLLEKHPGLLRSAERFGGRDHKYVFSQGLIVAMHYLLAQEDQEQADAFFEALRARGGEIHPEHPAIVLKEMMTQHALVSKRLPEVRKQAEAIQIAWAAFINKKKIVKKDLNRVIRNSGS